MNVRIRAAFVAAISALALAGLSAPAANAGILSILPGSCGAGSYSKPFAQWGDSANYAMMPGGSFEPGNPGWLLSGGSRVSAGNESFSVNSPADSYSLSLPARSSATGLAACTSIYHPTMRFFLRNTGSASSQLKVEALYPGLLGGTRAAQIGVVKGTAGWQPSPILRLGVSNLLSTLSLSRTIIAFRFTALDSSGAWSIDDVYLDPRMK
jgi:hypothetical protein